MKFDKTALLINAGMLLLIGGYGMATAGVLGLGIASLAIAGLNLPMAVIAAIVGRKEMANTAMIMLALWLLVGFSICSSGTLKGLH